MDRVKNALTRKIGPLPAWGWLLLAFGGIYFYRRYSATSSGTGTGSVAPVSPTPGTGEQVLQPGESIYDPTAGTLATAPGGGVGDTTSADLATAMDNLANAIGAGMPPSQIDITTTPGSPPGGGAGGNKHHKRRLVKSRGQRDATKRTSRPIKKQSKSAARSNAKTRTATGGRTTGRTKRPGEPGQKAPALHTTVRRKVSSPVRSAGTRQRALQPVVTHNVTQRRAATHPKPAIKEGPTVQHRPSAPAPRTVRAPSKPRSKKR